MTDTAENIPMERIRLETFGASPTGGIYTIDIIEGSPLDVVRFVKSGQFGHFDEVSKIEVTAL